MATAAEIGTDLSCTWDLDPRCAVVTGRRLLAEAVFRRLITPRGMLIDDPEYGTDITNMINDDMTPTEIEALRAAIVHECGKDERVESATVAIAAPPSGTGRYTITITLEDADGPFDLTLSVNDVTVEMLEAA